VTFADLASDLLLLAAVAGLFGLILGSFLNVCTLRWPQDQSVVSPRSRCPGCGREIAAWDNIPVLSWIFLRGRCRNCREPISIQYPLVELATGVCWALPILLYGAEWEALRAAVFLTLLLGIAVSDARFYIIPDQFSVGGAVIGLGLAFLPGGIGWMQAVAGALTGFLLLWFVAWAGEKAFRKEAMGGGDIKMMAMIGAFLGVPGVLLTIFLGSLLGAVIFGPISMKTGKLVPFGIFLALGAVVTWFAGDALVAWYMDWAFGPA
jgi:leader peptidase (prepilin peptidase)/N-methyltransferase